MQLYNTFYDNFSPIGPENYTAKLRTPGHLITPTTGTIIVGIHRFCTYTH